MITSNKLVYDFSEVSTSGLYYPNFKSNETVVNGFRYSDEFGSGSPYFDVNGIKMGLIISGADTINGIELGGLASISINVNGFQFAGIYAAIIGKINGYQIAGLAAHAEDVQGLQIAPVCVNKTGKQLGLLLWGAGNKWWNPSVGYQNASQEEVRPFGTFEKVGQSLVSLLFDK